MMKNSFLTSSINRGSRLAASKSSLGFTVLLLSFAGFTAVYLLIVNILGKIGLGETGLYGMVIAIPVAVFLVTGFATRISGPGELGGIGGVGQFQNAGGTIGAVHNALAGATEWFSLFFVVGIIAAFAMTNHDGLALTFGAFFGFAFMAVFIQPKLSRQNPISLASAISSLVRGAKPGREVLRVTIAIIVILCALAFLVAQIGAGSHIITLHFPMPTLWAAIALLAPVLVTILAGGMRGLTFANMLLYCVIGAAILLPAIWLSLRITGNPIPQLSYGTGALQPILQLEQQLVRDSVEQLKTGLEQGNFNRGNFTGISGGTDFLVTLLTMMAGTAAMPVLYSRIACSTGIATRARSLGWTLIFVALLVSAIPAFVTFMKFEIYRDLVGLPISQLGSGVDWLMNWAALEGGHHALVCGSPALDIQSITAACGNNPGHILVPTDLQFTPLMIMLGAGEIANMPSVYSAISYAGVLTASATTAGIAMMVIVNTVSNDLIFTGDRDPGNNSGLGSLATISRRLFVSRVSLIVLGAGGIWLAQIVPVPVTDFSLWAFTLAAGAIFPVLLLAIWWKPTTPLGALTGLVIGFGFTAYLLLTIEYGPDWIAQNGDEPIWRISLSGEPLKPMNSGIFGFPVTIVVVMVVSIVENLVVKWRQGRKPVGE